MHFYLILRKDSEQDQPRRQCLHLNYFSALSLNPGLVTLTFQKTFWCHFPCQCWKTHDITSDHSKQQISAVDLSSSQEPHHFPDPCNPVTGDNASYLAFGQGAGSSAHLCNHSSPLPQAPRAVSKRQRHVKDASVFATVYKREANSLVLL